MSSKITQENLQDLLEIFAKKAYEAGSCEPGTIEHDIVKKCEELLKLDYGLITLENQNGILSPHYPSRILIPEYDIHSNGSINYFTSVGTTLSGTLIQQPDYHYYHNNPNNAYYNNFPPQNRNIHEDLYDTGKFHDLIQMAKYARCRQRFAVPVILFKGKFVCRSATISVLPEVYGRKVVDYAYGCINSINTTTTNPNGTSSTSTTPTQQSSIPSLNSHCDMTTSIAAANFVEIDSYDAIEDSLLPQTIESSPFSYHEIIKSDIQLLKTLKISTIADLMVEQRKMKYFMPVSSSEKADPEKQYDSFNLLSLPYPGCEFFSKFRDNNYMGKNLHYNWTQSFIDATINVPKYNNENVNGSNNYGNGGGFNPSSSSSSSSAAGAGAVGGSKATGITADINIDDINWNDYKKWDLILITQNYLKAILKYFLNGDNYDMKQQQQQSGGILIHCISGWDRTPLFVSLIRLSLWADGLIHQSLSPTQITYLTLAYDWYLFGHQLPDRLTRGEEILFFCFHVLKHIAEDEFSVNDIRRRPNTSSSSGSSSVLILKSDCDDEPSSREDSILLLNLDQESNDSFSNCDMSSNENFCINNSRSPNSKRSKTSPISVPGLSACRQRNESTSSNGSWQVVTETGSIDSMMNNDSFMTKTTQKDNNTSNGANLSKDNVSKTTASLRKQRLNAVRTIFVQSYGKTIGLKFKEGSSMNLVTFIGTIAEQLF